MDSSYPVKLGLFAKSNKLQQVPLAPQGRTFGMLSSGVHMPEGGSFYIVEFDPGRANYARILGYADKYGRVFACDGPLAAPPAQTPQVLVQTYPGAEGGRGAVSVQQKGDGSLAPVVEFTKKGDAAPAMRLTFGKPLGPASSAATAVAALPHDIQYGDFLATSFLSLYLFAPSEPRNRASAPCEARVFDLGDIYMRLGTTDLFAAVDREVLEAENAWQADPSSARGVERYLVRMLREEGVVGKSAEDFAVTIGDARVTPDLRLIRTMGYAGTYYIDFSYSSDGAIVEDGLLRAHPGAADQRAALIGAEGALNRFLLLADYLGEHGSGRLDEDEGSCAEFDRWLIDRICAQAGDPRTPEGVPGRWSKHLKFAESCEGLRLPYRIGYDFRTNEEGDALAVNVVMPPVASFPKSTWNRQTQAFDPSSAADKNAAYARYAAHMCLLLASNAMHVSSGIDRVLVTCRKPEAAFAPVMSAELRRKAMEEAFSQDEEHVFSDPFSLLDQAQARYSFGQDFELEPVEALFGFDEGEFAIDGEPLVNDEHVPLSQKMRDELHVSLASDLNIFEDRTRYAIAEEAVDAMGKGVPSAIQAIKGIHDRSENLTVRRVCQGLLSDFAEGRLDAQSELEVREAFVDAYGFKAPMTRAYALSRENDDVGAAKVLDELQQSVESCGAFRDNSLTCYRYFDSYATRVLYERYCQDDRDGRKVLPLANEAYLVHDLYAQLLVGSIAGQNEALAHAKRCIELSPAYATSYLRAARAYFVLGDFESEAAMCIEALKRAWNPEDAGLAFYWLAFAYWKMDRFELAVACYRRCIALGSHMSDQAAEECAELVDNVKGLQRHTAAKEHDIMLEAGIPVDALRENGDYLIELAEQAVDSGANALGTTLASTALRAIRDDALLPTIRSLQP